MLQIYRLSFKTTIKNAKNLLFFGNMSKKNSNVYLSAFREAFRASAVSKQVERRPAAWSRLGPRHPEGVI